MRWLNLAIGRKSEITNRLLLAIVGWELVYKQLLIRLARLELVATYEHLDLEGHVLLGGVGATDAKVVVPMLLVQRILHVVVVASVDLEELVII